MAADERAVQTQTAPTSIGAEVATEQFAAGDDSAAISRAGLEQRDPICEQSLDLFVELLAGEAANLALKFLALGGVYLGGGIPPKILPKLREPRFLRRFTCKARMDWLLPRIPVHVILNDRCAQQGAVAHARRALRQRDGQLTA